MTRYHCRDCDEWIDSGSEPFSVKCPSCGSEMEKIPEREGPKKRCPDDIALAMDFIIWQTRWAAHFPEQCFKRIRGICEAVKLGKSMPFNAEAERRRLP